MKLASLARRLADQRTLVALALLCRMGALAYPGFLSPAALSNVLADNAVLGIAAIGTAVVLISGGIDLSVGSLMALASVALSVGLERWGLGPFAAVSLVLAGGAIAGLALGACIHFLELPAFIVTLAGMFLFRGAALALAEESVAIADPRWRSLCDAVLRMGGGFDLRPTSLVWIAALLVAACALRWTRLGRNFYALGGDAGAARLLGVPVGATRLLAYTLAGSCSALAGVVFTLYVGAGSSIAGAGLELEAIAAAVVGGVELSGGRGRIRGAMIGVLVFGEMRNLVVFSGKLDAGWTRVCMGGLLLAFLGWERWMSEKLPRDAQKSPGGARLERWEEPS
jgi:simple sugar transport system permease protein